MLPSSWEEVYGYVGLEFMAKEIPVIGNAVGAIPEYVRPRQTGWLNNSCTANELAELMIDAIEQRLRVSELGVKTLANRAELTEPLHAARGASPRFIWS